MTFLDALEETILEARNSNILKCLGDQASKGSLIWQFCMYNRGAAAKFDLRLKGHSTRLRVFHGKEKLDNSFMEQYMTAEWVEYFLDTSTYTNKHAIKTEMLARIKSIKQGKTVEEYKQAIP